MTSKSAPASNSPVTVRECPATSGGDADFAKHGNKSDKKFSEMSYYELNSLRKLVCREEVKKNIPDKVYTDFRIGKIYFLDSVTHKRKQADGIAWLRDRYLPNDELIQKIRKQLSYEKMIRQFQQCEPVNSWEKLLKT